MTVSQNLASSIAADGAAAVFGRPEDGNRLDAIRTANGGTIAWRYPGSDSEPDVLELHLGSKLVRVATKAGQRIAAINSDDTRTEGWKAGERERVTAEVEHELEEARREAENRIAQFNAADARESVPPPLGASDHGAALVDHECRQWIRGLSRDEIVQLGHNLTDPKHDRLVEALMRSPIPLPPMVEELARNAWIERRMRADPEGTRQRRQARERIEWLGEIANQVQGFVTALKPRDLKPIIRQVA